MRNANKLLCVPSFITLPSVNPNFLVQDRLERLFDIIGKTNSTLPWKVLMMIYEKPN